MCEFTVGLTCIIDKTCYGMQYVVCVRGCEDCVGWG